MVCFYKASHKCNPSSIPQSYVVVLVTGVERFPEWGYSLMLAICTLGQVRGSNRCGGDTL